VQSVDTRVVQLSLDILRWYNNTASIGFVARLIRQSFHRCLSRSIGKNSNYDSGPHECRWRVSEGRAVTAMVHLHALGLPWTSEFGRVLFPSIHD